MLKNYNILLIGTMAPDDNRLLFIENGAIPDPADIVQKYILDGLKLAGYKNVSVIGAPRIAAYPHVKIKKVSFETWKYQEYDISSIGYVNLPIIGFIIRENNIKRAARKWARVHKSSENIIIVYSMHSPFMSAARIIKKIATKTKIVLIVPDLPQYMGKYGLIKRALKRIDQVKIDFLRKSVDKYVLYTKHMASYLNIKPADWMVMEGIMDVSKIRPRPENKSRPRICVYAGNLSKEYAIDRMIQSFADIPDAELHIYGSYSEFSAIAEKNDIPQNVKYMGFVNPDEAFRIMRNASLLINPRPSNLKLSMYSCPSKTFEYMASGTPILMTHLPGLPEEYNPYIYFIDDETDLGYKKALISVLKHSDEELQAKGALAQKYLIDNKNTKNIMEKIIMFTVE